MTKVILIKGGREKKEKIEKPSRPQPMWFGCKRDLAKHGEVECSDLTMVISRRKITKEDKEKYQGGFGHVTSGSGGAGTMATRNDKRNRRTYQF